MSNGKEPRKFWGALAAIVAAIEGAALLTRKTAKAAPITVVSLAKEVMDLLSAIASGVGSIIEKLDDVIAAVKGIAPGGGGGGLGYPPNADGIFSQYVNCPVAQPQAYPLPDVAIPTGMQVTLLARNGVAAALNGGIIWVSNSEASAQQPLQSYPLMPGAAISYAVKNAKSIYIAATVPGEGVFITVEKNVS